jgi:hypothetical protein
LAQPTALNTVVGGVVFLLALGGMYSRPVRRSTLWTVTVTPLASIIGSGFLISAPILYARFGTLAVPALVVVNAFAIGLGLAIRHNIQHFDEARAALMAKHRELAVFGRLSSLTLGLAYVASVAFYVSLLSAFALASLGVHDHLWVRVLGAVILAGIGGYGYWRGLHGLEAVEKVAVNVKLAIISGLIAVLAFFALRGGRPGAFPEPTLGLEGARVLGGMLIITQGFETTKYLGAHYAVRPRIRALLLAQVIALAVYVLFVGLVAPLVVGADAKDETAIIAIIAKLGAALGVGLSLGAILSQFSAAVADTVGAGGILAQESKGRVPERKAYVAITLFAILLIVGLNVFSVMSVASRAFATYYALQCAVATVTAARMPSSGWRAAKLVAFPALGVVAALIAVFAVPAE